MIVSIILVNWNGWKDTLECLLSLLRLKGKFKCQVIICDNASRDESVSQIEEFLINVSIKKNETLWQERKVSIFNIKENTRVNKVIVIKNSKNLGFAYGCNVGIRYVLSKDDGEYIWLLNNDTIVEDNSLSEMLYTSKFCNDNSIVGAWVKYYNNPEVTQFCGGARYNPWIASIFDIVSFKEAEKGFDYIYGASMFFHINVVKKIGFLDEDFFLYYEELDFCKRAQLNGFNLTYSNKSIVYHKHGKSIGSSNSLKQRSNIADYYSLRNKILITKKFYRHCFITVLLRLIISLLIRVWNGELSKLKICWFCIKNAMSKKKYSFEEYEKIDRNI